MSRHGKFDDRFSEQPPGDQDERRLSRKITSIGLQALRNSNAPIPLFKFAEMVALRAGVRLPANLGSVSDGLRVILTRGNHRRLRYIGPANAGVGYVFDAKRRETWPVVLFKHEKGIG